VANPPPARGAGSYLRRPLDRPGSMSAAQTCGSASGASTTGKYRYIRGYNCTRGQVPNGWAGDVCQLRELWIGPAHGGPSPAPPPTEPVRNPPPAGIGLGRSCKQSDPPPRCGTIGVRPAPSPASEPTYPRSKTSTALKKGPQAHPEYQPAWDIRASLGLGIPGTTQDSMECFDSLTGIHVVH